MRHILNNNNNNNSLLRKFNEHRTKKVEKLHKR